jgi:large subunit ribosomal protein L21
MYAIIHDSGRQLKVEEGQELQVNLRDRAIEPGTEIQFENVLAIRNDGGLTMGQPSLAGARVTAEVLGEVKGPKLVVQKFRRRKNFHKKTGHRQRFLSVKIKKIIAR